MDVPEPCGPFSDPMDGERVPSHCWQDSKWEDAHFLGAAAPGRSFGIGGGKRIVVADYCGES
jgi:hypothetical protein